MPDLAYNQRIECLRKLEQSCLNFLAHHKDIPGFEATEVFANSLPHRMRMHSKGVPDLGPTEAFPDAHVLQPTKPN
jgi:hypothetical protein